MTDEQLKTIFNLILKEDLESFLEDAVNEIEKLARDLKDAWEEAKKENQ